MMNFEFETELVDVSKNAFQNLTNILLLCIIYSRHAPSSTKIATIFVVSNFMHGESTINGWTHQVKKMQSSGNKITQPGGFYLMIDNHTVNSRGNNLKIQQKPTCYKCQILSWVAHATRWWNRTGNDEDSWKGDFAVLLGVQQIDATRYIAARLKEMRIVNVKWQCKVTM